LSLEWHSELVSFSRLPPCARLPLGQSRCALRAGRDTTALRSVAFGRPCSLAARLLTRACWDSGWARVGAARGGANAERWTAAVRGRRRGLSA